MTMTTRGSVRREMGPMLRIAGPLVLAEVGWMAMGLVDTLMVGHLPGASVALAASSLAQIVFNTLAFGVGGVLLGLDTTIAQAHGAGEFAEANRWLMQGLLLAGVVAVGLMGIYALGPWGFGLMRMDAAVRDGAVATLRGLLWGIGPLLVYFALRRYLQAFNHVRWIAATLVTANVVNAVGDWLLIFDHHWGRVAWRGMGVEGSGIATSLARVYQAGFLIVALLVVNRRNGYGLLRDGWASWRPDWVKLRRLVGLGAPAGGTILVEIAVFAVVTFCIATLGPVALAGHEIALNLVSFTFMVPLGISAAASVRVGQAVGRGDGAGARAAGWAAIALGAMAMAVSCAGYVGLPGVLARTFTRDAGVVAATVPLLLIAAVFQFCDGLQVTAIGALRGAGDTKSGLVTHLCSYWLMGLPLGVWLGFRRGYGARGLWMGLCVALVVSGGVLLWRWGRVARGISEGEDRGGVLG